MWISRISSISIARLASHTRCANRAFCSGHQNKMLQVVQPSRVNTPYLLRQGQRSYSSIVEGDKATHKPTPFQQKVLVWTKTYPSVDQIPERIKRNQMKKAMDKFRVQACMYMIAATLVAAAVIAFFGRKARNEGMSVGREVLAERQRMREEYQRQQKKDST